MKTAANIGEFVNLYLKHQQQKIEMQTNKLGFNPIPDGGRGMITPAVWKTHSSTVTFYFCDPKTLWQYFLNIFIDISAKILSCTSSWLV